MNVPGVVVALRMEDWAFGGPCFRCGVGPRRAHARTAEWIRARRPGAVVNVGICGGLAAALAPGALVLVDDWVDGPDADPALSGALAAALDAAGVPFHGGTALTVREPLVGPADKARARRQTGAAICEMEGRAIARACGDAGVPFAALRAVADDRATVLRRPPRMLPALARALVALRRGGEALLRAPLQAPSARRASARDSSGT